MHSLTKWPLGRGSARLFNGRACPAAVPLLGFVICNGQLVATAPRAAWYWGWGAQANMYAGKSVW